MASASPASWKPLGAHQTRAPKSVSSITIRSRCSSAPKATAGPRNRLSANAADLLGLPMEQFRYIQADTAEIPRATATAAPVDASRRRRPVQGRPGSHRERQARRRPPAASPARSGPFTAGRYVVGDRSVDLLTVAQDTSLDTYVWNLLDIITIPNGCHVAEIEIDPETGWRAGTLHSRRRLRKPDQPAY